MLCKALNGGKVLETTGCISPAGQAHALKMLSFECQYFAGQVTDTTSLQLHGPLPATASPTRQAGAPAPRGWP